MRWPRNKLGKIALVVVPCFCFYRRPRTTSHITAKDTITAKDNITALDAFLHLHDEGDDDPTSHITAKDNITAKDKITALDAFLHLHDEVDEGDDEPVVVACPLPNPKPGFTLAKKQLGDYTSSQVYLIGDSVIDQLCILGRPGLCCNSRVPCKNNENGELIEGRDPNNLHNYYKELNASEYGSLEKDWQHLTQFIGRGGGEESYHPPVFQLAAWVGKEEHPVNASVSLLVNTLVRLSASSSTDNHSNVPSLMQANKDDILIAGLMGNHHRPQEMTEWEIFCAQLMSRVINQFPGRVVLISANPQHFRGDGTYIRRSKTKSSCGPFVPPLDSGSVATVEARQAIWDYSIYKYLNHSQTRVLDVGEVLSRFWMCHRTPVAKIGGTAGQMDCTHWNDQVYSLLAGMVLEALESFES